MGLSRYKAKRNFAVTAEPKGGKPRPKAVKGASRFVIQKHDASRLHYDFRLEMDGVLKSWAVPKGLPWGKGEKHLAVEVEDHPVEYATFEGIIPAGQYGGGTVMLWDRGDYYVYGEDPLDALKSGRMHIVLDGEKAKGEWALIRTRMDAGKPQWLVLKSGENAKAISKKRDDESVTTGRTMTTIASEREATWQSNRESSDKKSSLRERVRTRVTKQAKKNTAIKLPSNRSQKDLEALPKAKLRFIESMKPKLLESAPRGGNWLYELKFDGIRALALKSKSEVKLISRNGNDLNRRFPEIQAALSQLRANECAIDGEVVALDDEGRSSFQLLQARESDGEKTPIHFYAFDLLHLEGRNTGGMPLEERKRLLEQICHDADNAIRFSAEISGKAEKLLAEVKRRGLEGIIGKQRDSVYEPGRRSGAWIKLKCVNEQEFVIGGFTPPAGSRKNFGALLVGYYEGKTLRFAGKVGTGFNARTLAAVHKALRKISRDMCPFADLPTKQGGKWVQGITPSEMRKCTWADPVLVCQIKFAEWTRDAKLRQPVFLGLRDDKKAKEVRRESSQV